MSTSKLRVDPVQIANLVGLARLQVSKAECALAEAKEHSRLAKERRKKAKAAAREARKEVKRAKATLAEVKETLQEAETRWAQLQNRIQQSSERKRKRVVPRATPASEVAQKVHPAVGGSSEGQPQPSKPRLRLKRATPPGAALPTGI